MSGDVQVRICERLGVRFPRATRRNVYVRSERAGHRVMESLKSFITQRLKLKVNDSKSAVGQPAQRKFLGFSFTNDPQAKRCIAAQAVERFKRRVRELTRRTRGVSLQRMVKELSPYLRGWWNYFGFCERPSILRALDQWIRRRLRAVLWKQWKHGRKRVEELLQRGVRWAQARRLAGSACGAWRLAKSPTLNLALPNAYFDSLKLPRLYKTVKA